METNTSVDQLIDVSDLDTSLPSRGILSDDVPPTVLLRILFVLLLPM